MLPVLHPIPSVHTSASPLLQPGEHFPEFLCSRQVHTGARWQVGQQNVMELFPSGQCVWSHIISPVWLPFRGTGMESVGQGSPQLVQRHVLLAVISSIARVCSSGDIRRALATHREMTVRMRGIRMRILVVNSGER